MVDDLAMPEAGTTARVTVQFGCQLQAVGNSTAETTLAPCGKPRDLGQPVMITKKMLTLIVGKKQANKPAARHPKSARRKAKTTCCSRSPISQAE
jgi:hypothetical protein